MKKNIFRTILMVVIVLTLSVGSALSSDEEGLWSHLRGSSKLYDKSGETEVIDVFEAYWIEFWLTDWEDTDQDDTDVGGNTILPTDSMKFQFRENDEPEFEWESKGLVTRDFEPYYTGNDIFELNIDGLTFTADAYDSDYNIMLTKAISGDDAHLDMYLLGWINGEVPVEYQITLNWDNNYNCENGTIVLCGPWETVFFASFDYLPVTAPMPEPPSPAPIPEPGTMLLLGTGLLGIGIAARRKMKN